MAEPDRHPRRRPAPAPAPARNTGHAGQVPAPARRRDDRQPVPPDPRRSDRSDPDRHRTHHQEAAGDPRHRPRSPAGLSTRAPDQRPVTSPAARTATRSAAVRPLPIRPRPAAGDTPATYIRRLARANHLRPGYLNRYLRDDATSQISIDMLAALAARPVSSLMRAFSQADQVPPAKRRYFTALQRRELFQAIRRDPANRPGPALAAGPLHRHHRCHPRRGAPSSRPARPHDQADPEPPDHRAQRDRDLLRNGSPVHRGPAQLAATTAPGSCRPRDADPHHLRNGTSIETEAELLGHWLAAEVIRAWKPATPEPTSGRLQ